MSSNTSITATDILFTLRARHWRVIASAVGVFAVPVLDRSIGPGAKGWLTWILCTCEGTGLLFIVRNTIKRLGLSTNLYRFFGVWRALGFLPPLVRLIRGVDTDDDYFHELAATEWQIRIYFAPFVAGRMYKILFPITKWMVRSMWSNRAAFAVGGVSLVGAVALLPRSMRIKGLTKALKGFSSVVKYTSRLEWCITGFILLAYESLVHPFDRAEIAIARKKRDQMESLPKPYEYRHLENGRTIRLLRLDRRVPFPSLPAN
jgi:hypothetical protein